MATQFQNSGPEFDGVNCESNQRSLNWSYRTTGSPAFRAQFATGNPSQSEPERMGPASRLPALSYTAKTRLIISTKFWGPTSPFGSGGFTRPPKMLKLSTFDSPSKVSRGAGMVGVGYKTCNAPSRPRALAR